MKSISRAVLAIAVSTALVGGVAPTVAQATESSRLAVASADLKTNSAAEEYEEAQRQFKEQAAAYMKEARAQSDAKITISLNAVRNADKVRKAAAFSYASKRTLDNYRKMVTTQSQYDQLVLAAPRVKSTADMEYKIKERAIKLAFYDLALWPYGAMVYAEANPAPIICEDAYVSASIAISQKYMDEFFATVLQREKEFSSLLSRYNSLIASLYSAEVKAAVAYEKAVREHRASPSVITKSRMEQAKFTLDSAKAKRTVGVQDLKWPFTEESKSLFTSAQEELKSEYDAAREEGRESDYALEECVNNNPNAPR